MNFEYVVGIDIGSSYTKAVALDAASNICAQSIIKSGIDFSLASETAFLNLNIPKNKISKIVSTGVGRNNCKFSDLVKPEINCITKGAYHFYPRAITVVDIGGQDNKIIHIDKSGKQISFKLNRKCASGTGSFIEEMAFKLNVSTTEMNRLAQQTKKSVGIGSFCTVFAGTEIIQHIREGKEVNEIIRGIFDSVIKRIMEMENFYNDIILTGGACVHASILQEILKDKTNQQVFSPQEAQLIGAVGAALYGIAG